MTDDTTTSPGDAEPIIVANTPTPDQIASAIHNVVLVFGAVSAVFGFISKHDLAGLIDYIQTTKFVAVIGLIMSAWAVLKAQKMARQRSAQLTTIAQDPKVPDSVAKLAE